METSLKEAEERVGERDAKLFETMTQVGVERHKRVPNNYRSFDPKPKTLNSQMSHSA
jgi:hypothetical protein